MKRRGKKSKKRGGTSKKRDKNSLSSSSIPVGERSSSSSIRESSSLSSFSSSSPSGSTGGERSPSSSSSIFSGVASSSERKGLLYGDVHGFRIAINDPLLPRLNPYVRSGIFSIHRGIARCNGPIFVEYLVNDNYKDESRPNIRYREDDVFGADGPCGETIFIGSGLIDIGWIISDLKARAENLRKSDEKKEFATSDGWVKKNGKPMIVAMHVIRYPIDTHGSMGNVVIMFTNMYPNTFFYSGVSIVDERIKLQLSAWNGSPINDKREGIVKAHIFIENIDTCLSTLILTDNHVHLDYLYLIKSNAG